MVTILGFASVVALALFCWFIYDTEFSKLRAKQFSKQEEN